MQTSSTCLKHRANCRASRRLSCRPVEVASLADSKRAGHGRCRTILMPSTLQRPATHTLALAVLLPPAPARRATRCWTPILRASSAARRFSTTTSTAAPSKKCAPTCESSGRRSPTAASSAKLARRCAELAHRVDEWHLLDSRRHRLGERADHAAALDATGRYLSPA